MPLSKVRQLANSSAHPVNQASICRLSTCVIQPAQAAFNIADLPVQDLILIVRACVRTCGQASVRVFSTAMGQLKARISKRQA